MFFHGLRESIRKIWIAKPWQRPLFHVQEIQVNAFICYNIIYVMIYIYIVMHINMRLYIYIYTYTYVYLFI